MPLKKWLSPLLHGLGVFERRWRGRGAGFTVVLCYHRVVPSGGDGSLLSVERGLAADVFEAQIRFMRSRFEPVLPRDLLQPRAASPLRFAVTFDDGYDDNASVAAPILERLGVKAAFYVVTEFVGTNRRYWWERVAAMLRATLVARLDLRMLAPGTLLPGNLHELVIAGTGNRSRAHVVLCDLLRPLAPEALAHALDRLERALAVRVPDTGRDFPLMDWNQLRELERRGFEIGSHSANHHNLEKAEPALVEQEIVGAQERLRAELGEGPRTFAYPYGFWTERAAGVVKAAGHVLAFAVGRGVVDRASPRFAMPRVELNRRWPFAIGYNIDRALAGSGD